MKKAMKVAGLLTLGFFCTGRYVNAMTSEDYELEVNTSDTIPKQVALTMANYVFKGLMFTAALVTSIRCISGVTKVLNE